MGALSCLLNSLETNRLQQEVLGTLLPTWECETPFGGLVFGTTHLPTLSPGSMSSLVRLHLKALIFKIFFHLLKQRNISKATLLKVLNMK